MTDKENISFIKFRNIVSFLLILRDNFNILLLFQDIIIALAFQNYFLAFRDKPVEKCAIAGTFLCCLQIYASRQYGKPMCQNAEK